MLPMPTHPDLPLARTSTEAHLYMDLHPCECGGETFARDSAVVEAGDDLASRYTGTCTSCGRPREFTFRIPDEVVLPRPGVVVFGDGTPSELLDPGEWLWVADRYAGAAPADVAGLDESARRTVRQQVASAAAAMDEVLAFVPADDEEVPPGSFTSELGRAVHADEPGRFRRDRLEVVRDTYRGILAEVDGPR